MSQRFQRRPLRLLRAGVLPVVAVFGLSCNAEVRDGGFSPDPRGKGVLTLSQDQFDLATIQGQPNLGTSTVNITAGDTAAVTGLSLGTVQYTGPGGWLVTSLGGTTAPTTLSLTPNNAGLAPGYYTAVVPVVATSAGNSPQNVVVTLSVDSLPKLSLSPDTLYFDGTVAAANPASQTVQVTNGGGAAITGLALGTVIYQPAGNAGWLSANLGGANVPTAVTVQPNVAALAAGSYTALVPVLANGIVAETVVTKLTMAVAVQPPRISVSPGTATFAATSGGSDPASQAIAVTNTGGGTLTGLNVTSIGYTGGATGWMTATLSSTTGPATLTLQPVVGNLLGGTYRATVRLGAPGAANTDSVRVTFTVSSPPRIAISPSSVSFSANTGGANPGLQAVNITNSGGGILSGLQVGSISYGLGQPGGWLTATLNGTTAPSTISLRVTLGSLPAGLFTASVPVTSSLGIPSQTIQVSFNITGGSGAIVGLTGLNQTGFPDSVLPQPVVVRVLTAAGGPAVGVSVTWTPGQGGTLPAATTTTDQNGEVRATWKLGPSSGTQVLVAATSGQTPLTVNAFATQAPGSNPGEPAGYQPVSDRPFNAKVEDGWLDRGDNVFTIQQDPNAPKSAPNVGQAMFRQGRTGGTGPINTYYVMGQYNYSEMYLSFYFKLDPNWVGAPSNGINKVLHIWINGGSVVVFSAQGQSGNPITPQMRLQNVESDPRGISFNLNPNIVQGARLVRGQWHRIEILLKSNVPGSTNGEVSWWLDGTKIASYTNIGFISATNPIPGAVNWQQVSWNPTWGAPADVVPADQTMQIDHFYISGQ